MPTATLITFVLYLATVLCVGAWAYWQTRNLSDYVLGGRRLGSLVTALSAGASDMSGWLLLGLPGAIYAAGLGQWWIGLGLALGAYANWRITAPRLRLYTEAANNAITLPDYFTARFEDRQQLLRIISALVILIFFTVYVAAGLTAGAKLFEATFDIDYRSALWVGSLIVVSYTFVGGFLAVSWTDVIQGLLMLAALLAAPVAMVSALGGPIQAQAVVALAQPGMADWFDGQHAADFFFSLGFLSLMAWGLGYFGQPHLLARFMAARSLPEVHRARRIAMSWMLLSMGGALAVGYWGIGYFQGTEHAAQLQADSEKVFILAAQVLFHPLVAGFLLAAILAAVMSTVDSQLLVSSSAVSEDFYRVFLRRQASDTELVWVGRLAVLAVALIATAIAQDPDAAVLQLVSYAWAGFGAAFGPVIVLSLIWPKMTRNGALAGIVAGALTVILWTALKATAGGWVAQTYEMIPGVLAGAVAIWLFSRTQQPSASMLARFRQVEQALRD